LSSRRIFRLTSGAEVARAPSTHKLSDGRW
jgi:hypothetical protein